MGHALLSFRAPVRLATRSTACTDAPHNTAQRTLREPAMWIRCTQYSAANAAPGRARIHRLRAAIDENRKLKQWGQAQRQRRLRWRAARQSECSTTQGIDLLNPCGPVVGGPSPGRRFANRALSSGAQCRSRSRPAHEGRSSLASDLCPRVRSFDQGTRHPSRVRSTRSVALPLLCASCLSASCAKMRRRRCNANCATSNCANRATRVRTNTRHTESAQVAAPA